MFSRTRRTVTGGAAAVLVGAGIAAAPFIFPPAGPKIGPLRTGDPKVAAATYDLGQHTIALPSGESEELAGAVYYPARLAGRHHLILLLHGTHDTCTDAGDAWPCHKPGLEVPSYLGYGYLADALVRQGDIVVSVAANATIGSADTDHEAVVLNRQLELWRTWNTSASGPFGATFTGHLDLTDIGLIGHSRGGEAMARYAAGDAGGRPVAQIAGVLLLAPASSVIPGAPPSIPPDPMAVTLGTCDGDVGNNPRAYVTTPVAKDQRQIPRSLVVVTGANHNYYNTEWSPGNGMPGAADDAGYLKPPRPACAEHASARLSQTEQHQIAEAIATSFFRAAFAHQSTATALADLARTERAISVTSANSTP
jgi:hypothetical protein